MKQHFKSIIFLSLFAITVLAFATEEKNGVMISRDATHIKIKGREAQAQHVAKTLVGTSCPQTGKIYFKVGEQKFVTTNTSIAHEASFFQKLNFTASTVADEFEVRIPFTLGCEENPADYLFVQLKDGKNHSPSLTLSSDASDTATTLKYIQHLNGQKMCQTTKYPEVIACIGSKTVEQTKVVVMFVLPIGLNGSLIPSVTSELPIHARCEGTSEVNMVCAIREYFPKFLAGMPVARDELSKSNLLRIREQLVQSTKSLMLH